MNTSASVIIVTYNHKRYLDSCIRSVLKQDHPLEVIVVDNCSSDGTSEFIETHFPNIRLIKNTDNYGYSGGNNIGVKYANGEYVVILNPDTIVEAGWLRELIEPLENNRNLITTSKIFLFDGLSINTCGTINHFTGLTFTRGLNENPDRYNIKEIISGISGCSFAIRKSDYNQLGGFDENFFVYNEDSDFSWRACLKGFKILYVPTSKVRHDYTLKVTPFKIYHLEKGRYIILKKYLSLRDFIFLSPSLMIAELLTLGYALKMGRLGLKNKFRAMKDGLLNKVTKVENSNKSTLFESLHSTIPVDQLTSNNFEKLVITLANKIFNLNFRMIL